MNFLKLAVIVFAVISSACAKSDRNKWIDTTTPGPTVRTTLVGKPTQDALISKYKTAKLKCDLRTAKTSDLLSQSTSGDALSWDLLMDFSATRTFELATQTDQNRSFEITLDISKIQIFNYVEIADAAGSLYKMESSPVAEIGYSFISALKTKSGEEFKSFGKGKGLAHESVVETLVAVDHSSTANDLIADSSTEVRCFLATEPKDEFKKQTVVEKKK